MALVLIALILVTWANAAPVLAHLLLGARWGRPLDGGRVLPDGQPVLGGSKTWRGCAASLLTTPWIALLLGLTWGVGLALAVAAMAGDIAASFIKRRMGLRSSQSAVGLDQIPESIIPVLVLREPLSLGALDLLLVVGGFLLIDLLLTPLARALAGRGGLG
jgi:CDP-diglyceride synthetase